MDLTRYKRLPEPVRVSIDRGKINTLRAVMEMNGEKDFTVTNLNQRTKHLFPAGANASQSIVTSRFSAEALDDIFDEAFSDPDVRAYLDRKWAGERKHTETYVDKLD